MNDNSETESPNDNTLERRDFGKVLLAGAVAGGVALTQSPQKAQAAGNKWSATGLKAGVSHQRPNMLTPDHLNYLKQMGVEYLEVRVPSSNSSYDEIMRIRETVEGAGLHVFEIMLSDKYSSHEFALGTDKRDEDIAIFNRFVKDLGKAGIDTITYAWHTGGSYRTGQTTMRGCKTRLFELEEGLKRSNPHAPHEYDDEEMWANYTYFIERVLPVAEDAGVRLQLHPNDPPVTHAGVARLFRSVENYKRAMDIANNSPYSGILFCTGSFGQMFGPDGEGEDVEAAIRHFGSMEQIYQVHYRNVSSTMPDFYETFPDNGYQNMYKLMKALGEVNFNGVVCPDHVPEPLDSKADKTTAEAYIFGYIRAAIQAVNTELGLDA